MYEKRVAVRVGQPHPALERAVEAEVARVVVVDHDEPVVPRVARLADGEAVAPSCRSPPGRACAASAPRARGRAATSSAPPTPSSVLPVVSGRERADREDDGARERADEDDCCRERRRTRERDDQRGRDEHDRADREHLVGAELGHEPERRHERPDDAARCRDREQAPGGPPEPLEELRREPDGDRRDGGEHDAHRPEEDRRGEQRVEPRARIPLDDHARAPSRRRAGTSTSTAPSAIAPTRRYGRRPPVGDDPADPVPDREPGEHDPDQRAPDVERAAERRREHPAGRDLDAEQHGAREEHGDGNGEAGAALVGSSRQRLKRSDAVDPQPGPGQPRLRREDAKAGFGPSTRAARRTRASRG